MTDTICLDENYSTTKLVTQEKPEIINNPEDKFDSVLFLPKGENRKGEGGLRTQGYFKKSYEDKPLVSIITVVYNGEAFLEETILSVINQSYDNVEYIIIDGGSTDGTVDIIKKYEDRVDYWVSERDSGIYDAMNKGLKTTRGKYIAILNADDYYNRDAIKMSMKSITKNRCDYSYAQVRFVDATNKIRPIYPLIEGVIYQEMPYPHVSAFIKSDIYKKIGLFDTSFKIAGDHDMALRIHLAGYQACYLEDEVARLEVGGISNSINSNKEFLSVAIKNGKNKFLATFSYFKQVCKVFIAKNLPSKLLFFIQNLRGSRFR